MGLEFVQLGARFFETQHRPKIGEPAMNKNEIYFKKYCELALDLLKRDDRDNPAIKSVIRFVVREASNHSSDLPGHDNKLGSEIVSILAYQQISEGNKYNLIGEHVVPVSEIVKALRELAELNTQIIAETIKRLSLRAVITKDEDKQLKDHGLSAKMPERWDGKNAMARYEIAGIKVVEMSYKEALKNTI